jgi:chaperonin GroES
MNDLEIKLDLNKILNTDNIANLLDENQLNKIGGLVNNTYRTDLTSCEEEFAIKKEVMDLAMQDVTPRDGKPNTVIPLIYAAAQRFNADAFPALMRDGNVVQAKILGYDGAVYQLDDNGDEIIDEETGEKEEVLPPGKKLEKGERIAKYENFLLQNHIKGWEEDEDKLLFALAILGDMFKKTYYDPYKKQTVSEILYPFDVVVNINAQNMKDYPVSLPQSIKQNEVRQRTLTGEFLEYDIDVLLGGEIEDGKDTEEYDKEVEIIEQHRLLDLDGDGYKEPYTVTIANERVLNIRRNFEKKDVNKTKDGKVLEIVADIMLTHRIFIPNPKGTFYSLGFGHILRRLNRTVNGTVNQLMESGINANMTRGLMSSSIKLKGGEKVLKNQEWWVVSDTGFNLKDSIVTLDSKEPSVVLYQLMEFLIDVAKQLSNITDILGGNIPENMQATTALASIEQGLKEFKAIYKRQYRGLTEEIQKIHKIVKNIPERFAQEYIRVLDDPEADFEKDFNDENLDIQLTADLDVVTNTERVAKATVLMQFIGNPQLKQDILIKRILNALRIERLDELVIEPQPKQPDPMAEFLKMQQENERLKAKIALQESQRKLLEAGMKGSEMKVKAEKTAAETENVEADTRKKDAETAKILDEVGNDSEKVEIEREKLYQQNQRENEKKENDNDTTRPGEVEKR